MASSETEERTYPADLIRELERANETLWSMNVYSVCHALWQIEILPAGLREPPEAVRVSGRDRTDAVVSLRIGDRFVWLNKAELETFLEVLELARNAAQGGDLQPGDATV